MERELIRAAAVRLQRRLLLRAIGHNLTHQIVDSNLVVLRPLLTVHHLDRAGHRLLLSVLSFDLDHLRCLFRGRRLELRQFGAHLFDILLQRCDYLGQSSFLVDVPSRLFVERIFVLLIAGLLALIVDLLEALVRALLTLLDARDAIFDRLFGGVDFIFGFNVLGAHIYFVAWLELLFFSK